ncbi:coiled-coil domain-containing protein 174 isoform X2 [Plodia interpunctella]|uniref:coiled-coil domain-containing protein 174 isoform X2 n=1 Tax=Plodia interpunctella TaxID=58824 RepID=UPI0023689703|nr:coiled-coil domain-containing protein 174 isoform X2 [Plodia interpunctella]
MAFGVRSKNHMGVLCLVSLKAELLRKQEEVNEKKQSPLNKIENFKPAAARISQTEKDAKSSKKSFKESLKAIDTEELEACRKAKLALEKKAELYEHLSDGAGTSQLTSRFLVDFNTKKQQECVKSDQEDDGSCEVDESDWTEFTDCLGRTRKCLKSDLELFKQKDGQLSRSVTKERLNPEIIDGNDRQEAGMVSEKPLLVQKTNDYLQSLREKWEEKERELIAKDKDIHYQDLLFDEARIHGVGYYSFSTDEAERRKQMEELMKRRQETLRAQQESEQARAQRQQLAAARLAAARARQRARKGLPPEDEPAEKPKDFATCLLEYLTQHKEEADAKATEEERRIKEEKEKERQKLREAYVRDWDIGKEGVEEKVKKFREMTQEEYVEQQRDKRIDEFAPPQTSTASKSQFIFDDKGNLVDAQTKAPVKKTWADVRRKKSPSPPDINYVNEEKGLYFSTSKKNEKVKYRNFVKSQEPSPIINELDDDNNGGKNNQNKSEERISDKDHAEIAPPPIYDYYGPPPTKYSKHEKPFKSDIREAYAQGAKSLEVKSNTKKIPRHYDFTFD